MTELTRDTLRARRRYRPRWLNWLRALVGGYFWLPCPMCGKSFGGHEWTVSLHSSWGDGEGVCPMCAEEAERLNQIRWATTRPPVEDWTPPAPA